MTEENIPVSKYVNVPADNISSWCTSSRGEIFTLNNAKSLIYRAGTRRPTNSKREGQDLKPNNNNSNNNTHNFVSSLQIDT
jgi:2-keto-3-deoxy-galactonokinase